VLDEAQREAVVRIGQVGAISRGLKGQELSEMRELADAGVAAYSDDGKPVSEADLLLHALRYARGTGRPLLLHLEDKSLSVDGVMHEGRWSARLGLRGVPSASESGPLARDLQLVRYAWEEAKRMEAVAAAARSEGVRAALRNSQTGEAAVAAQTGAATGRQKAGAGTRAVQGDRPLVYFQHLSSSDSVELVRRAKTEGLPIAAEATPHHLLLTDERLATFDQNLKVNPPLRSEADREALVAALADSTIDCVGTDHAPHAPHEKEVPIEEALSGTTGLETAFAALYTGLVVTGKVSLARLIEAMSTAPCRALGISAPRLEVGTPADFFVADLEETWEVTPAALRGKSRNCAFLGERLKGRVRLTVVDGARRFARARGEV
jgi:dihydroorotase